MKPPGSYIIRGGLEGGRRLEVLARVLWPTTSRLLAEAGLAPGMTCLDLGCGGGDVAVRLAAAVGPQGHVVGVDMDETKLGLARQLAARSGLANIEFRCLDVQDWDEEARYDLIYARFLLTHLTDPPGVLRRMRHAARLAGTLVVEDIDFGGSFCHPPCAGYDTHVRLYRAAAARRGADADIGPRLYGMLLDAGLRDVRLNVVQPTFASGEGKQLAVLTLVNIADAILAEQLVTQAELHAAIEDLTRFTDDPRTLIGLPRVFQLWGRHE